MLFRPDKLTVYSLIIIKFINIYIILFSNFKPLTYFLKFEKNKQNSNMTLRVSKNSTYKKDREEENYNQEK